MTAVMVPPLLPPNLSAKEGRDHLRVLLSMLHVPEGRAVSLTLGDLLSLMDDEHQHKKIDRMRDVLE